MRRTPHAAGVACARMGRRLLIVAALSAFLGACGANDSSSAAGPQTATAAQAAASCPAAGFSDLDNGFLRMPSGAQPGGTPLIVVVMPGGDGDRGDRLGLAGPATRQGYAVLYPTREGGGFWTLNDEQGTGDVENVSALLESVIAAGCVDPDRISITGVSNGAGMATRMSCALRDRFAAVVPVAAGYRALDPCPANARASFLAIHGSADTVVPYNGKTEDNRAGSVARYTARRAKRNGCSATPRTTRPRALVTRIAYRGCDGGLRVEILRLSGTDHGWPGSSGRLPERNPSNVSAATELLKFIRSARRVG
jgi:polyhydroxybutyrate depolymerase